MMSNQISKNDKIEIPIFLGLIDDWQDHVVDLTKIQNLLITGVSGCGKSTLIHNILLNVILHTDYNNTKLILFDPKIVDLSIYNMLPNLLIPVVTDIQKAYSIFHWLVCESSERLNRLSTSKTRNIYDYNEIFKENKIPYLIFIFDGYLLSQGDFIEDIMKIISEGKQTGIYLIFSSPDISTINKLKNSFSSYACFRSNKNLRIGGIDDKIITKLIFHNMLYLDQHSKAPIEIVVQDIDFQLLSTKVNKLIADFTEIHGNKRNKDNDISVKIKSITPVHLSNSDDEKDPLFVDVGWYFIESDKASIGNLQRKFKIGFNRAARIIDQLCEAGVVGAEEGTKARKILMTAEEFARYYTDYL